MKQETIRLRNYYEIAMSMGNSLDLKEMLEESLLAYLRSLDCSAGMVLAYTEQPDGTFKIDPVYAVPQNIDSGALYRTALQKIPGRMDKSRFSRFLEALPIKGEQGEDGFYFVMELLGFGLLLLVKTGESLPHSVIEALTPLNEKLAGSAIACMQKEEIEQVNKLLKIKIVEHKKAEEALSESEINLRTLFESTPIGIVVTTFFGRMLTCNLLATKVLGYPASELKHLTLKDVFADPRERFRVLKAFRKKGFIRDREILLKRKDGSTYYASLNITPFTYEGKKALLTVFEDITARKEMEEALRRSEKLYRAVVEDMPHMICRFRPDGKLTFVNSFYCEYLKRSRRELLGQDFFQLFPAEERGKIKNLFASLSIENPIATYRHRVVDPKGRKYWQEWIGHALYNDRGQFQEYQCLGRDITRQKQAQDEKEKLEKQLQHAQRMEGIGTLAGGIAHDFNNLLMGIQGRTSLLKLAASPSHPSYEHLAGIENYVKSAADLTRQLLGFARGGKYEVKPKDLNTLVKNQVHLFARTRKEIVIHEKYEETPCIAEIDQNQVEQVLLNIFVNAWQAMPGGGDIYVETGKAAVADTEAALYEVKPGEYVNITITDTGVGMDESTKQRIFDPFFTTKEMGRGTGLGLASAYGIVRNHGGFIKVRSKKGEGAAFGIFLPASKAEAVEERELLTQMLTGDETILFVDDEYMVIEVGEQMLQEMGYTVLLAEGGEEAVDIFRENKDSIDMVILDMIMPGMGGGEVYDRLKEIDPCIKVLLSSGYSINSEAAGIMERGCHGFIQKPFDMNVLSRKIREILDKEKN